MKTFLILNLILTLAFVANGIRFNVSKQVYKWGYGDYIGPNKWGLYYPYCNGLRQSPINIIYKTVQHNQRLQPLKLSNFDRIIHGNCTIRNNGKSIDIFIPQTGNVPTLQDYRGEIYQSAGFHFHWGSTNSQGSETWLNNRQYPLEAHVVFWNTRFGDLQTALYESDGLAVIGTLIDIGKHNPSFDLVIESIQKVKYNGQKQNIKNFSLRSFVAESLSEYFLFNGSLTTPPCTENVLWHVMAGKISISPDQLNAFRNVYTTNSSVGVNSVKLLENFRPLQKLNNRAVYSSFDISKLTGASAGLYRSWLFIFISTVLMFLTIDVML